MEKCEVCGRQLSDNEGELVFDFEGEPLIACPKCENKFERAPIDDD